MEIFLNDKYKLLEFLYKNKIEVSGEMIIIITQDTIAKKLHFGKGKVNRIINELLNNGYLDNNYTAKGSYKLTNKSIAFFETMMKVGIKLND